MAKRTAIIDIGSNSARMVVYEKTSRYAFHLLKEIKSRVRVGEGAYEKGGILQEIPMQRTFLTLQSFIHIAKSLQCKKSICVATSALRDAPNASVLTNKIQKELGLHVKIIDGAKEAYFGGIAALNLLAPIQEATSIDIGGGSTELAKIENGKIVDTLSLNLGTVRLKELFFDTKKPFGECFSYIDDILSQIPEHFNSKNIFGIGGTLRALSTSIMEKEHYPLETVHGYHYEYKEYQSYIKDIAMSSILKLKDYPFKKDRYDTIREGCSIFYALAKKLQIKNVISCGAGVREGVYLCDLLRGNRDLFPLNFNPSVKSLLDRFALNVKDNNYVASTALKIFDVLEPLHRIDEVYKYELKIASKLYNIGTSLSFYQSHLHGFYFILNGLNFGFTHEQKILIALLTKYHTKKLPNPQEIENYSRLLPDMNIVNWLSFILSFAKSLNTEQKREKCTFRYENNTLHVNSSYHMKLAKEAVKKIVKPTSFAIIFQQV